MSVKNKQNSSVNFLVRAEFLTDRPPASGDHYTPRLRGDKKLKGNSTHMCQWYASPIT